MVQIPGGSRPEDVFDESRSGRFVAWGNALLGGATSPDDMWTAIRGGDETHTVLGVPGDTDDAGCSVGWGVGTLRRHGVTGFRLALPEPGHPLGLTGPASFNTAALAAGEAVLTVGTPRLGFVPEVSHRGPEGDRLTYVVWHGMPVDDGVPADVPQLRDAERELAEMLREATAMLVRLDVAGGGPQALRALEAYRRRRAPQLLAPGYQPQAVRVLESARQVRALVALAATTDGTAVSAGEMAARAEALRPLARAARRATVAAYNARVDEPAHDPH